MTPSLPKQTSAWKKVRLLLWKNFLLQKRHWFQTALDLFLPVLFTFMFVWESGKSIDKNNDNATIPSNKDSSLKWDKSYDSIDTIHNDLDNFNW